MEPALVALAFMARLMAIKKFVIHWGLVSHYQQALIALLAIIRLH